MYLRHTVVRKGRRAHTYWRLVRSVRRGRKVVQETAAHLGELDGEGRVRARLLAQAITGRADQRELFEPAPAAEDAVAVRLDRVRVERARAFGDVWLGWTLWQALRLDELCTALLPRGREAIPWAQMAAVLVIARLCEPSSELHIAEDWYRTTALEDLLGIAAERIEDHRLYRALDRLLPHKAALEQHLRQRLGELFALEYDLLLYDVTSTYFEGRYPARVRAVRGESDRRHHGRGDRGNDGGPLRAGGADLGHGPGHDQCRERRVVAADGAALPDRHAEERAAAVGTRAGGGDGLDGGARRRGGKAVRGPRRSRNLRAVPVGGTAREGKGDARALRAANRDGPADARGAPRARPEALGPGQAGAPDRPAARAQHTGRGPLHDRPRPAALAFQWSVRAEWDEWARHSEGCYVLRTNITDWDAETLWRTYVQLTDAEAAFRIQKSELSIRPIWHQRTDRVQAHIFVCFLAYVLWKTLEQWQSRAGLGNSPRTILDELHRIQSTDVVLPLADNLRRELRIRCVARPDKAQALLLDRLGLRLPERLRPPPAIEV